MSMRVRSGRGEGAALLDPEARASGVVGPLAAEHPCDRDRDQPDLSDEACRDLTLLIRAASRPRRRAVVDADDAAQEAWLALLMNLRSHPGGERRGPWLAVVVRNRLANLARYAARRSALPLDAESAGELPGREEDPAVAYERGRARASVRAALAEARGRISEASHRIVILMWVEGLTVPEVAEALGMTPSQVRDRHRRALPILRDLLGPRLDADRDACGGGDARRPATESGGMMP